MERSFIEWLQHIKPVFNNKLKAGVQVTDHGIREQIKEDKERFCKLYHKPRFTSGGSLYCLLCLFPSQNCCCYDNPTVIQEYLKKENINKWVRG